MLKTFEQLEINEFEQNSGHANVLYSIKDCQGKIQYGYNGVSVKHIPVVTPLGDTVLVDDLSFTVKKGDHLMITGPNGLFPLSLLCFLILYWVRRWKDLHSTDSGWALAPVSWDSKTS